MLLKHLHENVQQAHNISFIERNDLNHKISLKIKALNSCVSIYNNACQIIHDQHEFNT